MEATAEATTYNGWKNYETWVVKLWMDNEQATYDYWRQQTAFLMSEQGLNAHRPRLTGSFTDREVSRFALAEQLKESHEDETPTVTGVYADLLNAALSEVDWYEIAKSLIADHLDQ